jgi:hypothetical protein
VRHAGKPGQYRNQSNPNKWKMKMSEDHLDDLVNDPQATVARWAQQAVSGKIGDLKSRLHESSVELTYLRRLEHFQAPK